MDDELIDLDTKIILIAIDEDNTNTLEIESTYREIIEKDEEEIMIAYEELIYPCTCTKYETNVCECGGAFEDFKIIGIKK